ncbi:hypothetical protein PAXRUDRAFT_144297 [Paxillus rubicundulus Ve08.2h10]|uniref:Uncharacterized protein n=1 Tax=Paxillus rubicundulus Ve08.2h10 TaxID=930991 RepID=A0A0D0D9N4_9AGAM|nr:hypothetical protein PAXRUDRAFT_144297 [Paxillus rubicundulus Ve08.2h10]
MPQNTHRVRFTSEAMMYHLPPINEAMPVPLPPKCQWKSHRHTLIESLPEKDPSEISSSIELHAMEGLFPPIVQLVVPDQPNPGNKNDLEATSHQAHLGGLVIASATKTTRSRAAHFLTNSLTVNTDLKQCLPIRPPSQPMSAKIIIPSRLKQACMISATCQNLSMLVLPPEPKAPNSKIYSTQSMPGPSNSILATNILTALQSFAMDMVDVDPLTLQINPLVPKPDFQHGSSKKLSSDVLVL